MTLNLLDVKYVEFMENTEEWNLEPNEERVLLR